MRWLGVVCAFSLLLWAGVSFAQEHAQPEGDGAEEPVDEATKKGRDAILRGLKLARNEQWGDALAAFEEAAAARDAPLVQYNIAVCERALGRYVAAQRTAKAVLAAPEGLSVAYVDDLKAYVSEFDKLLVHVRVSVVPAGATLTIDGRAPERNGDGTILLDPGSHLFLARRKGHQDVVVHKTFRPGQHAELTLRLDEMPATVVIKSEPGDAIVRVDDREVGVAPAEFERPAGSYRLEVFKDDYETYSTQLDLAAGQRAELTAELLPYQAPIYERWWFWTSLVGAVATGVVTAVVLTLPEPVPPDYETGSSGWLVDPQPAGAVLRF